ncbi:hypothetical protein COO91_02190 [Nostoc flagelliforme CCNUN1]|uniref:Uncharacterized protein n=1 Tax=Nostoc flagelliforme CCNUN1 TaxID=2038116 RepID=A0A2K8SLJ6_9NOSO|nr:hypothetical protein COO91_02190 [Nostoc flagelliforme CCNUN1]
MDRQGALRAGGRGQGAGAGGREQGAGEVREAREKYLLLTSHS